jgi:cytochrome o ubiquinol oxidase operon protein cyoD
MNKPLNNAEYLEEIGALPRSAGVTAYVIGFVGSLLITLGAYTLATHHALTTVNIILLGILALLQFAVQCIFFLHLGPHTDRPRAATFAISLVVVLILIVGSIVIMQNLNGRMMPDAAHMQHYMEEGDAF